MHFCPDVAVEINVTRMHNYKPTMPVVKGMATADAYARPFRVGRLFIV